MGSSTPTGSPAAERRPERAGAPVVVPARTPFDGAGVLRWLSARAVRGIDAVEGSTYRWHAVAFDVGAESVAVSDETFAATARRLFDADRDPAAVAAVLAADPMLAPLVALHPGVRVPGVVDPWELVVRAIVGQQVSVRGAATLLGRLVLRFGCLPDPQLLASADLSGLGLTRAREACLQAAAAAVASGAVDLTCDPATARTALLSVRGIGPWTVEYVALRALRDPDAFPVGDLGLRRSAAALGLPADGRGLAAHAERWRPYRAYAAMLLWRGAG